MKFLIATDFDLDALVHNDLDPEIHYGGWFVDRIPYQPQALIKDITRLGIDVLVVEEDQVPRVVFEKCPSLRVVISLRSNPVNVDLEAAGEHGVLVLFTPGRNAQSVAELSIGLMIDLLRNSTESSLDRISGNWGTGKDDPYLRFRGRELQGRKVGLVGFGAIGQIVARLLHGFDADVAAYDPYQPPEVFKSGNTNSLDLDELLRRSEIISIHTPLNPETTDLLGKEEFSLMKPGVFIINTARAAIINQGAFLEALDSGLVAGAALDVHYQEPPSPDDPFLKRRNVLLTPHIGGATYEVISRGSAMAAQDLTRYLRGDAPIWAATNPRDSEHKRGD